MVSPAGEDVLSAVFNVVVSPGRRVEPELTDVVMTAAVEVKLSLAGSFVD